MDAKTTLFTESLWGYYAAHGRNELSWRQPETSGDFNPYKILVSELMLQQTQVTRVIPKFNEFLTKFPTVQSLAAAQLGEVLQLWSGLGYNRRAKFLWQAAQAAQQQFPDTLEGLVLLPGVGKNTAGAILAYAYNQPAIFLETNVRTVLIHHFFTNHEAVPDAQLIEVLQTLVDHEHPREFYWALMDYGSHLKQTIGNISRQSKVYSKQSAFKGSRREVRGQVLRLLSTAPVSYEQLAQAIADERLDGVLQDLTSEGLIAKKAASGVYCLP